MEAINPLFKLIDPNFQKPVDTGSQDPIQIVAVTDCNSGIERVRAIQKLVDLYFKEPDNFAQYLDMDGKLKQEAFNEKEWSFLAFTDDGYLSLDGLHFHDKTSLETCINEAEYKKCHQDPSRTLESYVVSPFLTAWWHQQEGLEDLEPLTITKVAGEHRELPTSVFIDPRTMDNLLLIELACTTGDLSQEPSEGGLMEACFARDEEKMRETIANLRNSKGLYHFIIRTFKAEKPLAEALKERIDRCLAKVKDDPLAPGTTGAFMQHFVNTFLNDETNYLLYNMLLIRTYVERARDARAAITGKDKKGPVEPLEPQPLLETAEWEKKKRAVLGMVFSLLFVRVCARYVLNKWRSLVPSKK